MFDLKKLSPDALERSLEKAMRYRLLNEPEEAESICLDVLAVAPDHQNALVTLFLALTDQFPLGCAECVQRAAEMLPRFQSEFDREYYAGILAERRASARLIGHTPGSQAVAYELYLQAMAHYERAESMRPQGNEDALLRWNTCARQITRHKLTPTEEQESEPLMLE